MLHTCYTYFIFPEGAPYVLHICYIRLHICVYICGTYVIGEISYINNKCWDPMESIPFLSASMCTKLRGSLNRIEPCMRYTHVVEQNTWLMFIFSSSSQAELFIPSFVTSEVSSRNVYITSLLLDSSFWPLAYWILTLQLAKLTYLHITEWCICTRLYRQRCRRDRADMEQVWSTLRRYGAYMACMEHVCSTYEAHSLGIEPIRSR